MISFLCYIVNKNTEEGHWYLYINCNTPMFDAKSVFMISCGYHETTFKGLVTNIINLMEWEHNVNVSEKDATELALSYIPKEDIKLIQSLNKED